jgi:hypothetical protein
MEYSIYKFYPGQKIIADFYCEYSSVIIAIIPEIQKDGHIMNLIVYKDWNKYKKYYDYHCEREILLSTRLRLIKEKIENGYKEDIPKSFNKIVKSYKIDRIEHLL